MPRISDAELAQLKSIDLAALMRRQGYVLKPHGKDQVMACPFHKDNTPSLVVSANNLWHCMGACQKGGSVIDWVMRSEGVSFRYACELLRGDLSTFSRSVVKGSVRPVKYASKQKLPELLNSDDEDKALLKQVMDYYHQQLLVNERAMGYLKQRGLDDEVLIKQFTLGFSDRHR